MSAYTESSDMGKMERRRSDTLMHIVNFLFMVILSGLTWWMSKINDKAERVPVLEERMTNLTNTIQRIEQGVNKLVDRRGNARD